MPALQEEQRRETQTASILGCTFFVEKRAPHFSDSYCCLSTILKLSPDLVSRPVLA
jgi:hypothetical protein